jgi:hypothetical protein
MALRMMVYRGLLYQDLVKRGEVLADGRLPPVLPIVLYNGSQRWSAVTDVFDLIPPVPGLVEQFKPRLKYLLIDENAWTDSELASLKNLVAAVFRIEHPASPAAIGGLLSLLDEWLTERPDLRRMFALWIRATLMRKAEYRIVLPQIDDLQELNQADSWRRRMACAGENHAHHSATAKSVRSASRLPPPFLAEGARFNDEIHRLPTGKSTFIPKGVFRFKTHEDANRHQLDCLVEGMADAALARR